MEKQKQPFGKLSAACCASREWGQSWRKLIMYCVQSHLQGLSLVCVQNFEVSVGGTICHALKNLLIVCVSPAAAAAASYAFRFPLSFRV